MTPYSAMPNLLDSWLTRLPDSFEVILRIGLIVLIAVIALAAIARLSRRLLRIIENRQQADGREAARRALTLVRVLRYVLTLAVALIAGISILSQLGVNIGPILGAAGVVGIAIGFGAQSLVKDYFTGFFLLLENQIRVGDLIDAGGKSGLVEELTLRYLRLRDYDGNVHYIPNSQISVVTNMSLGHSNAVINIEVAYKEDLDAVMARIGHCATLLRQDPAWSEKILDFELAGVEALGASGITIRCRFRVQPLEQGPVRREFNRRIKADFDAAGIEIPFPHRKLLYETPPH
jgi:small-conductance mechanosensitive channel